MPGGEGKKGVSEVMKWRWKQIKKAAANTLKDNECVPSPTSSSRLLEQKTIRNPGLHPCPHQTSRAGRVLGIGLQHRLFIFSRVDVPTFILYLPKGRSLQRLHQNYAAVILLRARYPVLQSPRHGYLSFALVSKDIIFKNLKVFGGTE